MHILAILFVLASLGLTLAVIGGMIFAHRDRIAGALAGHSAKSDSDMSFVAFHKAQPTPRPARRKITRAVPPLALAA